MISKVKHEYIQKKKMTCKGRNVKINHGGRETQWKLGWEEKRKEQIKMEEKLCLLSRKSISIYEEYQ